MRRARAREIAAGVLVLSGVVALLVVANRPASRPVTPAIAAVVPASPLVCKPVPPVRVALRASGTGTWVVRVEASTPVDDAVLRLGAVTIAEDAVPEIAWRGALAGGEVREIEVRWTAPAGAREVWAEVATDEGLEERHRARTGLVLAAGRQASELAAHPAAAPEARTVVDPQSGQSVFEVRGVPGGGR